MTEEQTEPRRVLVAEDEGLIRLDIVETLTSAGFDVVGEAADRLSRHLVSPVRFDDGIRTLMACGQTRFIEAGFGGVLFNLVKRIDATLMRERIGTRDELDAFVA